MTTTSDAADRLRKMVDKLSTMSIKDRFNPYETFEWPQAIPADQLWMSKDLLTVHGTDDASALSDEELARLSRWESINFYSLNVHGIRELLAEVVMRIHQPGYEGLSQFLHHFIGEENEHMWYFAEFCLRYGGKLYPSRSMKMEQRLQGKVLDLIVFIRIQAFEEIVDHFNTRIAAEESIHPFIRQINRIHHRDESRHIAFGQGIVAALWEEVKKSADESTLKMIDEYVRGYLIGCVQSLYNPTVYRDAALPGNPYQRRKSLLQHEGRRPIHDLILKRPMGFLLRQGILREPAVVS